MRKGKGGCLALTRPRTVYCVLDSSIRSISACISFISSRSSLAVSRPPWLSHPTGCSNQTRKGPAFRLSSLLSCPCWLSSGGVGPWTPTSSRQARQAQLPAPPASTTARQQPAPQQRKQHPKAATMRRHRLAQARGQKWFLGQIFGQSVAYHAPATRAQQVAQPGQPGNPVSFGRSTGLPAADGYQAC